MSRYSTGGTICSVVTCKSKANLKIKTGESISFHRFPKDPHLRKEWIKRCYRKEGFNPENKRICSKHFPEEDFEDICRAKIMNVPPKKLKSTAIPCLNLQDLESSFSYAMKTTPSCITESRFQKTMQKDEQMQIVSELLKKEPIREVHIVQSSEIPGTSTNELSEFKFEFENQTESVELCQNEKHICEYIQSHYNSLKTENEALKRVAERMKKENNKLLYKNKQLQISLLHLQNGCIQPSLVTMSQNKKSRQNKM